MLRPAWEEMPAARPGAAIHPAAPEWAELLPAESGCAGAGPAIQESSAVNAAAQGPKRKPGSVNAAPTTQGNSAVSAAVRNQTILPGYVGAVL